MFNMNSPKTSKTIMACSTMYTKIGGETTH
jgi:hypothetical protein